MATTEDQLPAIIPGNPDGPLLRPPHPGEAPVDVYFAYLATLPRPASKQTMAACLDRIAEIIAVEERGEPLPHDHPKITGARHAWWLLRRPHTLRIASLIADPDRDWSPAYINKHLSAIRGILKECWNQDLISTDDYLRAKNISNVSGERLMAGRSIELWEIRKLLESCDRQEGPIRHRDTAIFMVLQSTGIRREELAKLRVQDYNPRERALVVIGKRDKQRRVWLHPAAAQSVERWLRVLGGRSGPMFPAINRHHTILKGRSISPSAVNDVVERHRKAAKLEPMSPHDFRRTVIGELYDAGGDSQQAMKIAGHAQSSTTDGYDRRGERGLRDLIDLLPVVVPPGAATCED